jgi:hypothetical protein
LTAPEHIGFTQAKISGLEDPNEQMACGVCFGASGAGERGRRSQLNDCCEHGHADAAYTVRNGEYGYADAANAV